MFAVLTAAMCLCPLPAAAHQINSEDTIAARQRFFGAENVDARTGLVARDKVILSWLTNTTFALAAKGHVVLLDSFATRLEVERGRTNFVIKDLVDLKPEAIFIGHGHGDHADNAAYIAGKSGATIYASPETCAVMHHDLARMKADPRVQGDPVARIDPNATIRCTGVTSPGSLPGSELVRLRQLEPDLCILGFKHLHSVLVPRDPDFPANTVPVTVDPRDDVLFPEGIPLTPSNPAQPGQMDLRTGIGFGPNPGGPIAIGFQFVLRDPPNLTVTWTNSAGALKEGRGNGFPGTPADGQRIVDMFRGLPGTDVLLGIASTANFPNNALRDTVMYTEALRPRIFVPSHHTTGTIGAEGTAAALYANMLNQFAIMEAPVGSWPGFPREEWPSFRWLTDPMDYSKPIVFDPRSPQWRKFDDQHGHRPSVASACR
jgi:hypothetical protein